jgi:hypothetical protein
MCLRNTLSEHTILDTLFGKITEKKSIFAAEHTRPTIKMLFSFNL